MKQTPEFRSSLQKTVRFQLIKTNTSVGQLQPPLYDGEVDDPSFEPGRTFWPMKYLYNNALGHKKRKTREYQIMLKTVHAVAGKESHVAQRAFAWVIINLTRANLTHWGGNTKEGVCKKLIEFCKSAQIDLVPSNMDQAWNAIDQWLPNVEDELSKVPGKGWDPSRGSLGFLKEPRKKVDAIGTRLNCSIQFGNLKFYKDPVSLFI